MGVTLQELRIRQALSLEDKIRFSQVMIQEWYEYWKTLVYVAFSGGKDSTVLLHLIRSIFPEVPAVFCNTGLEFPEIIQFVLKTENVTILRPKKTFKQIINKFGYPVISKKQAQYIYEVRNANGDTATKRLRLTGIYPNGKKSPMSVLSKKWRYLVDAPFGVSEKCCHIMKTYPARAYSKRSGRFPYRGIMASEGGNREHNYLKYGCNAFSLSSQPRSDPISFWTEKDIWNYIEKYNVSYSKIYDMGYKRTGCIYCGFGAHMEKYPNRFQRLRRTHFKLWKYCMDQLGMKEVLKYIGIPTVVSGEQLDLKKYLEKRT